MDSVTIILDREQHRPPVNLNRSYLEKGMLMVHPAPDGPPLPNRGADKKKSVWWQWSRRLVVRDQYIWFNIFLNKCWRFIGRTGEVADGADLKKEKKMATLELCLPFTTEPTS